MRFIVFALVQSPAGGADADVYRNETDLLVYAEELGFDAVWMAEHHFHGYCITPDPLLLATHVAARTKRIRIGTAANVLPLSHPVRVAEQTAMLDILSEGRLDVGFAKGYGPREFMGYGVDQRESEERFREALEIIFAAWTQDEFSYDGRHFTIPKASIRPRPRTKPHPSAYVATTGSQPTIDLAAKLGLPFYVAYRGRKHFAEIKERYRASAAAHGHAAAAVDAVLERAAVMQTSYLAPTNTESYDEAKPVVARFSESINSVNFPSDLDTWPAGIQELVRENYRHPGGRGYQDYDGYWNAFIYGDAERGVERVRHLQASGFQNVLIGFSFGGMPYDRVRRSMELFAEKVMPRFR